MVNMSVIKIYESIILLSTYVCFILYYFKVFYNDICSHIIIIIITINKLKSNRLINNVRRNRTSPIKSLSSKKRDDR